MMLYQLLGMFGLAAMAADVVAQVPAAPGGIQGWMLGILGAAGAGFAGTVGVFIFRRWVVPVYSAKIRAVLAQALNPDTPDPKLNELVKAHALSGVRLAEYLIPDRGKGIERFAMVDAFLAKAHIPEPLRKALIEEAVWAMDDEAKRAIAAADAPPSVVVVVTPAAAPSVPPVAGLLLLCLLFASPARAADDSLLSLPGLMDTVTGFAKEARPMGFVDLHGKYGGGVLLALRTLKDGAGIKYAAFGVGGTIKEGEHFRAKVGMVSNLSALSRRMEKGWGWWDAHTEKLTLPDIWIGPALSTPMPGDSVTWKDFGNATTWADHVSFAVAIGF